MEKWRNWKEKETEYGKNGLVVLGRSLKQKADRLFIRCISCRKPGIDGILVTVGLCIIALLLCVVMKDSLAAFISKIVKSLTDKAETILSGV